MKILLAGQNGIIGSFLYEELKNENEIIGIGKGEFNSSHYIDLDLSNLNNQDFLINYTLSFNRIAN